MSSDVRRSGSCLCGGVQFSVTGEPLRIGLCHCKDCRKTSGSAYQAFAIWPLEAFETAGIVSTYGGRSFCPTCGGRVTSVGEEEVEVMLGSLDVAPTELEPTYELWIVRREHWLQPLPDAQQFEHDRVDGESPAEEPGTTADSNEAPSDNLLQRKLA
ncbi:MULTISPECIES: GFA family protein [Mesorhizobium]|uniref:GFA family protein n=1 Tax=Mesorhizobium abyssinicae TaxID=1209958 RepID=A0ABU5AUR0_9HYPH|nr:MULTISPECIES: GFA family protein [Mesorhizobium]MDX8541051.1 GFA family protein [Mesorhizobium abyssinicae]RUW23422.1 GFA family protein [Mesorhizobium sp. M4B.F.Ca.ET.013.02.1.1]RVD15069.1 GFA family protein [Mesorhizobium sp. M4B.F.Ca.ET.017.02.2.1]RVD42482.1 GFA family protein [Mesorhizobium sp. M4B.F.Ca.ET.019.03.1.1]RWF63620.1 MAG: GFA family protein [Mesorhizobium sp.]